LTLKPTCNWPKPIPKPFDETETKMTVKQKTQPIPTAIRPLVADDLNAVIALDTAITGKARRGFFETRLKAAIERPRDYIYVGLIERARLSGFAMARIVEGEFGKPGARASLDAITVAPDVQGHGVGHRLMTAVKEILTHKAVSTLESQVDWENRVLLGFLGDSGFTPARRMVLSRDTDALAVTNTDAVGEVGENHENDFSAPDGDQAGALAQDAVLVRSMSKSDLAAIVRIDRKLFGADRSAYFQRLQHEAFHASGVRVSLVAKIDGFVVGFIMARVDFGEYGRTIPEATMDALGIDPGFQGQGIGHALMQQLASNLAMLHVEYLHTEVAWNAVDLIAFFSKSGFAPTQTIAVNCRL